MASSTDEHRRLLAEALAQADADIGQLRTRLAEGERVADELAREPGRVRSAPSRSRRGHELAELAHHGAAPTRSGAGAHAARPSRALVRDVPGDSPDPYGTDSVGWLVQHL